MRKTNSLGIQLIKRFEGLRLRAYVCEAGKLTIGYGHTANVTPNMTIDADTAERLLIEDLGVAERAVERFVKVPLTDNQFAALVSLTFNIGSGNFKRSTLLMNLNLGAYNEAAKRFEHWVFVNKVRSKGLERRRAAERELFLTNPVPSPVTNEESRNESTSNV